jgi:hypothetical protein
MGVGVCYVSVTNITKRKEHSPSWKADGWARTIHSNPPHSIPLRFITLCLLSTLVIPTGLPPSRSPTKSRHAFLSVSTQISLLTKSVHSVAFPTVTNVKPNNHSPFIAHSTALQVAGCSVPMQHLYRTVNGLTSQWNLFVWTWLSKIHSEIGIGKHLLLHLL